MSRQLLLFLLLCFCSKGLHAQWTAKDSLWLNNILQGKDTFRLNPETMRSIQEGTFLNSDPTPTPMISAPAELPILKDFSEFFNSTDTTQQMLSWKDLPPGVFWLWDPKMPEPKYKLGEAFYNFMPSIRENSPRPSGHDFMGAIAYVLNKEYRQKVKNSKNAVSWKFYGNLPTPDITRKQQEYLKENPDMAGTDKSYAQRKSVLPLPLVKSKLVMKDTLPAQPSEQDSISIVIPLDSLWSRIPRE